MIYEESTLGLEVISVYSQWFLSKGRASDVQRYGLIGSIYVILMLLGRLPFLFLLL